MDKMLTGDDDYRYSVAWIDCQSTGSRLGRSVLTRGDHARLEDLPAAAAARSRTGPGPSCPGPWPGCRSPRPSGLLNPLTVAAFNEFWFRKAPRHQVAKPHHMTGFFHPLDGVGDWNRLYGPRGFLQYQFVVPDEQGETVRRVIERLTEVRLASFLAVLKRFGPGDPGPLSFPMPGLDPGPRPPGRLPRPRPPARRPRRAVVWPPAAGSTWPRTRGCHRPPSGPCTRGSTSGGRCGTGSTPTGSSAPTSGAGSASAARCAAPVRRPPEAAGARARPEQPRHGGPDPHPDHDRTEAIMIDAIGRPQSVLVLGGSSEIAQAIVARLVPGRCRTVVLAGREGPRLSAAADEARARRSRVVEIGALRRHRHRRAIRSSPTRSSTGSATSTWWSWPPACSATRRPTSSDPAAAAGGHHHQLHRTGGGHAGRGRPPAPPGTRPAGGALLGGRRAGPEGQLHLRVLQGRARRLRPGPGRLAGRDPGSGSPSSGPGSWWGG